MATDLILQAATARNRYFYGLLMDAERFEKDQNYFNSKRQLLNRFVEGAGVVCGLALTWDSASSKLTLSPGIAIDAAGREIVVPAASVIDVTHLTDAKGKAAGPVPAGSTLLISILYMECKTDPVPVLVPDCDYPNGCAPGSIQEGFAIVVTVANGGPPAVPGCALGAFPLPPGAQLQQAVANQIAGAYQPTPMNTAIPLGRLTLPGGPLDAVADRPLIYGNALLYQLITCLASQVAQIAGTLLTYVSGDNQVAAAGKALANPLVVAVVDGSGNPLPGAAAPEFTVTSGGGSLSAVTPAGPGEFQASWTLGAAGTQTVTAKTTQSSLTVTFHAAIQP